MSLVRRVVQPLLHWPTVSFTSTSTPKVPVTNLDRDLNLTLTRAPLSLNHHPVLARLAHQSTNHTDAPSIARDDDDKDKDQQKQSLRFRDADRARPTNKASALIVHRLHQYHRASQREARRRQDKEHTRRFSHRYNDYSDDMDDSSTDPELAPHKQLLMDAAAEIRNDQVEREKARPQNVGEGTLRLLGDSIGGVALGAAALVMGPVQGYKQSGPKGIVGGALGGLAVGVASTTMGIGSGITHFVQGTARSASKLNPQKVEKRLIVDHEEGYPQPSTVQQHEKPENNPDHFHTQASYNGGASATTSSTSAKPRSPEDIKKIYLEQRKQLYGQLMAQHSAESAAASMDGLSPPVDMSLYDELQVDSDATPAQIRKAYYRMAQLYHPDKHPNDPQATERFQKISNAYQVLSDPVKREEYHRVGESAAADGAMMDPKTLFILMFADFEHIVGDLATATILMGGQEEVEKEGSGNDASSSGASGASGPSSGPAAAGSASMSAEAKKMEERRQMRERKRQQFQTLREEQLVKLLERRFEPWMAGDENSFIEHAKNEVRYLRDQPFGRDCLKTAGYIYRKRASKVIDSKGPFNGVANFFEDIGDKAHSFKSKIRALEGGIKAMTANERAEENETIDDAARREAVATLGAVWLSSVVDIESTLRKVLNQFLRTDDKSPANKDLMKRKAQGLLVLGKIFDQA